MKKTIKLAVVAALALGATSAFATNGTSLIGYGAKSRAMGGTGVAQFHGAETVFANPALITSSENQTEGTIGATLLMPSVSYKQTNVVAPGVPGVSGEEYDSTAGDGLIPSVAAINKINDSVSWGLGLYGVGGMGVDYREEAMLGGANAANDSLMLMRASVPVAYTVSGFSVAIAPVIEYGQLAMNGSGVTSDIAFGYELAAAYAMSGITVGVDYKSAVTHDFKSTFNSNIDPTTGALTTPVQSKLDTPATLALGLSYNMGASTVAFDYKQISYGSAKGMEDFGWEDQSVYAVGYEYATKSWALRVGYNYGESPVPTDITDPESFAQVLGSLLQFPGIAESHFTIGGSYSISETMSFDLAYMYATGSATATLPAGFGGGTIDATNDQSAVSGALNFAF